MIMMRGGGERRRKREMLEAVRRRRGNHNPMEEEEEKRVILVQERVGRTVRAGGCPLCPRRDSRAIKISVEEVFGRLYTTVHTIY